ncbi:MAG: hypothetical protein Q8P57_00230 [Candidatus Pacearchaeota archaeon]|nr:hypothetical protein [Candidatus Pacearchaeota archaeon]
MKIIGFNISGINAYKNPNFTNPSISTNIEFTNVEKEKLEILKDQDALKTTFKFSVTYKNNKEKESKNQGEVSFEGFLALALSKDESKEFTKAWKKKEVPERAVIPLYNFILRKCSVKALQIQEDLSLPSHMPIPQVKSMPNQNQH